MKKISLNEEMLIGIQADMTEKKTMLNDEQINAIAQKANDAINIPIIGEKLELIIFAKIVKFVDMKLYEVLPNEYYALIHNAHDGIDAEDAAMLELRLGTLINDKVNIPFISEKKEKELIDLILGMIIKGLVKGAKLEGAQLEA